MARSPSGRPFDERIPWSKPADSRGPEELRELDSCRECPWEPCLTPEVIREFGFSRDDAQALETVAEALFRSELSDDAAVAAFDRVFGWCAAQDFGNVDVTDETMALIRARRAS